MWLHVNAMLEVNFHEEIQTKQEEILIFRNKSKKLYGTAIPFMCRVNATLKVEAHSFDASATKGQL